VRPSSNRDVASGSAEATDATAVTATTAK